MVKLYDYQEPVKNKLVKKLKREGLALLMAEERFGKTLTAFAALDELNVGRVLVVSVKAALHDIVRDYEFGNFRFTLDTINYESLSKQVGDYDAIVFDESSKIAAYPKVNGNVKAAFGAMEEFRPTYTLLMNATPAVESYAQFFHPLKVAGFWKEYASFYRWFTDFGIPYTKRVAGGREVQAYDRVKEKKILKAVRNLMVTGTRKDAGFTQHTSEIKMIEIKPKKKTLKVYATIAKDNYIEIDGQEITADSAVKVMSKLQQVTSGFMYDDEGMPVYVGQEKYEWLAANIDPSQKTAIYAKYTFELELMKELFPDHLTYPTFKDATKGVFIAQVKTGAKGIDLHTADRHIFVSLDFSGETFSQGINRMHNKKRVKPVVAEILHMGLIDKDIAATVSDKRDFNTALYKRISK